MPRKATPAVSPILNRGRTYYRVTFPTAAGRKREIYSTRKKAGERLREVLEDARRFGATADAVTATQRADASSALQVLAGTGRSLTEAARFLLADIKKKESGKPMDKAIEAFIRSKDASSETYRKTLKSRMHQVGKFFPGATTTGVTGEDCQRMLDGAAGRLSPGTVGQYRDAIIGFFNFCQHRGWRESNPAIGTTQPKIRQKDVAILTPGEAAVILANCPDDLLPGVAIAMFCGLRQAEISRLNWRNVNLAQGIITVGSGIAKTASRRVCSIPANAKAWLTPHVQEAGPLWPASKSLARAQWVVCLIKSGYGPFTGLAPDARALQNDPATGKPRADLVPWPGNAMRHSAISYRIALERDLPRIAYESGNSPSIIQRHYNGLASPEAARAYFALTPEAVGDDVLEFRAA